MARSSWAGAPGSDGIAGGCFHALRIWDLVLCAMAMDARLRLRLRCCRCQLPGSLPPVRDRPARMALFGEDHIREPAGVPPQALRRCVNVNKYLRPPPPQASPPAALLLPLPSVGTRSLAGPLRPLSAVSFRLVSFRSAHTRFSLTSTSMAKGKACRECSYRKGAPLSLFFSPFWGCVYAHGRRVCSQVHLPRGGHQLRRVHEERDDMRATPSGPDVAHWPV